MPGSAEENLEAIWGQCPDFLQDTCIQKSALEAHHEHGEAMSLFRRLAAKAMETRDLTPAVEDLLKAWVGNPQVAYFHRLVYLSMRLDALVFANKTFLLTMGGT